MAAAGVHRTNPKQHLTLNHGIISEPIKDSESSEIISASDEIGSTGPTLKCIALRHGAVSEFPIVYEFDE